MSSNIGLLRHLLSEIRKTSSSGKIKDSNLVQFIFNQYRKFKVTELQHCRAQDEMKCLANSYVSYLQSLRKYKDLVKTYHSAGERTVEETADIVGFKLPNDPKKISSVCPKGYFKLQPMTYCFPWLTCRDIPNIKIIQLVGYGSTKSVYLGRWNQHNVSYISLRNHNFRYDFQTGLHNLIAFSPSVLVVQLLGFCQEKDIIITEYHEYNNAINFKVLQNKLTQKERFHFCLDYAKIIYFLHSSPIGVLVNCDSNDLMKLLSQFLITSDFKLILSDTDTLPEVKTNSSIKCGSKEIKSNFVAPEQLWSSQNHFHINAMKGYNEKTDIWKLPDVCLYFLKNEDVELLQYMLFEVHNRCKEKDPLKRLNAKEVVSLYIEIFMFL